MKYNIFYLSLLIAVVMSSCSSFSKVEDAKSIEVYKPALTANPLITDLDIQDAKVSGAATGSTINVAKLKDEAIADAIKKSNSDVIIHPSYSVVSKSNKSTVTVTGFAATYKNFRPVAERDSIFFKPDNQLKDNQFTNNIANNDAKVKTEKKPVKKVKSKQWIKKAVVIYIGVLVIATTIILMVL